MEAALVALLCVFVAATLSGVGFILRLVIKHEKTDAAVMAKTDGLGDRMDGLDKRQDRFESYVMGEFADIKADLKELLRRSAGV